MRALSDHDAYRTRATRLRPAAAGLRRGRQARGYIAAIYGVANTTLNTYRPTGQWRPASSLIHAILAGTDEEESAEHEAHFDRRNCDVKSGSFINGDGMTNGQYQNEQNTDPER